MNKLLSLVNLEVKRSMKFYIPYICIFSFLTLALNLIQMYRFNLRVDEIASIKEVYNGVFYGVSILYNNSILIVVIIVGLAIIGLYYIKIWTRDINEKNKSIHTLLMLPSNRYSICISKIISEVVLVYGFLISQIVTLFLCKNIFNFIFSNLDIIKTSLGDDLMYNRISYLILPVNFVDFIMVYIVAAVAVLSFINLVVLIIYSYKNCINICWWSLLIGILSYGIYIYPNSYIHRSITHEVNTLVGDLVIFIPIILISNICSYYIINKRFSI